TISPADELMRLVRRFSPWAAGGAAIVVLSGVLNTFVITGRWLPAWAGAYDRLLWLKIGLVGVVAALSAWHVGLRTRRPAGAIWRQWRRLVQLQSGLAAGVLLAAAGLINQSPPLQSAPGGSLDLWVAEGAGPYEVIAHLDPGRRSTRAVIQVRDAHAAPVSDAQVSAAFGAAPAVRLHRSNSGAWSGALRTPEGNTALNITVARPGQPRRTAAIPLQLPFRAADAELKAATARFMQLTQAQEVQNVSSGALVVQTRFDFAAPDRVHYTLSSGRETIGGPEGHRWDRAGPETPWVMGDWPSDYRWPLTDWSLDSVQNVRHIGTERIDGRLCDVLALVDTRGDGVYFRLWIDQADGLLRRERMVTTAHFMTADFNYPDRPIAIAAPKAQG
ncbi:MAG TPA: CopD family protein, partial [Limnochordia bacterium]|nr:CopD family protein [Limnochordia bacterium]